MADATALTPASVTRIVTELISAGLVLERRFEGPSKGAGRRPSALEINNERLFVAGVHIGINYLDVGLFDLEANLIARVRQPEPRSHSPEATLDLTCEAIESLTSKEGLMGASLAAVGVGTGGWVDPRRGAVRLHPQLGWEDVPVQNYLETRLQKATIVENIVNGMALAESSYGRGVDVENLMLIMVGNVLGAGIIIGGQIYSGSNYLSGQLGHLVVSSEGPMCSCGNRGCLEALAADSVLINELAAVVEDGTESESLTIEKVIELAEREPGVVRLAVEHRAKLIGRMVATAVNLFNPSLIVLAGSVALGASVQLSPVLETAAAHMFPPCRDATRIELSSFGDAAGLLGAAAPALQLVYSPRLDLVEGNDSRLSPAVMLEGSRQSSMSP